MLHRTLLVSALLLQFGFCALAVAADKASSPTAITTQDRFALIRGLNAEFVFVRRTFPMGTKGLTIKNGVVSPSEQEVQSIAAQYGPAAKRGDRAQITDIAFKGNSIIFEINGGAKKKKKWYQHLQVGIGSANTQIAPDNNPNPHGSYVALQFAHAIPALTPDEVKKLLAPVFDFSSLSASQAYIDSMPPKVKQAMKNHEVLVGMNRDMVMYSKGRPEQKVREHDALGDYEEWIYGHPPQEVEFVRIYGDEVKRVELMKLDGEKIVKTQPEMSIAESGGIPSDNPNAAPGAASNTPSGDGPGSGPTLMRPGERPAQGDPNVVTVPAGPQRAPNPKGQPPSSREPGQGLPPPGAPSPNPDDGIPH